MRTYSELSKLQTFEDRFRYLELKGMVGQETFGYDRWLNQKFYRSPEWKHVRDLVIMRDNGCDLGINDRAIYGRVLIHHMNPIRQQDITGMTEILMDPEFLITVSHETHNAIHYGDESLIIPSEPVERRPFDMCPWKGV